MALPKFNNLEEYNAFYHGDEQVQIFENLRKTIKNLVPEAIEDFCLGMPCFRLDKKIFLHFSCFSKHYSLFPGRVGIEHFKEDLVAYKCSVGGVQIPYNKKLPQELLEDIIKFQVEIL